MDSTFIEAPSFTKNQKNSGIRKRILRKGGIHGILATRPTLVWIARTVWIRTVKVTAANIHDVTVTSDLLTGEEEVVYMDSSYLGVDKRPEAQKKNNAGKTIDMLPL